MYPWHTLVCEKIHARSSVPEAAIDFIVEVQGRAGRPTPRPAPREVPERVMRVIEAKRRQRRDLDENDITTYLDSILDEEEFATAEARDALEPGKEATDDLAGLIVFEDRRSTD